ncbi:MAG TPA: T9SS type A sorting domain-containing protein [Saprospiraceae bacterium]|nr:T9SS type A sorting domain-containing protein [Saprospiraceae bacterium]
MKKIISSIIALVCAVAFAGAQTTILDFENPATSTTFQYFGSGLDGSLNEVIANPNASGMNTSSMVAKYVKPAVAEVWAGCFSNPNPATAVNLIANGKVAVKVHMDHIGSVTLKFESSTDGGDNWAVTVPNTKVNEWEELVFDASLPSIEPPNTVAAGHTYARVVMFFDLGTAGTGADVTSYFDDIVALPAAASNTTILDFETPATGTVFQYFGSPLDGTFTQIIANPNASGINTSSMVTQYVKPAVSEVWAGAFSNPNPTTAVNLIANGKVAVKVHMDHIGSVTLKLEGSTDGGDNWAVTVPNTKVNQWEELVFDASLPSIEPPNTAAAGHTYTRVVMFFDLGTAGTGTDVTSYFDDIVAVPAAQITTILDFETPATGTAFQYFGSALDGTFTQIIANPNATGINTSSMVTQYLKPAVSEVWAGAFSNPNPTTPVDLSGGGQLCVKVHMDHIGNLALKFEESLSGKPNWIQKVSNTKVGEWEELCFDASLPSLEPPFETASGAYAKVVVFFDFGTAGTGTDVTSYFDDIVVKGSSAPQIRTVNFKVDMNAYSPNFSNVYISGSFNNWSGDANPLSDPDFDGIWEGSITVPNGSYEYKVTLDNWAAEEKFIGTEECTKRVDQFVNRLLLVSADTDLPKFCFNSCYACGEEVKINFKLGMGGVTPNPDGVWLAGGGNFDVPGGKYKMDDTDADGIYEVVVPRKKGFNSFYTFANGPCPDYSCKENLTDLPCGNPANFNDRFLPEVQSDVVVATCFGACFTNADCVSATNSPVEDAQVFSLLGNPSGAGFSVLEFGSEVAQEKSITLTNGIGQQVRQWNLNSSDATFKLQTADLQSGLYFVTVRAGDRFFTRKLVK